MSDLDRSKLTGAAAALESIRDGQCLASAKVLKGPKGEWFVYVNGIPRAEVASLPAGLMWLAGLLMKAAGQHREAKAQ